MRDSGKQRHHGELMARITTLATARGMIREAPEALSVQDESPSIRALYGVPDGDKSSFGCQCLIARRLVESGVRFVQLYHWGWDNHGDSATNDLRHGLVQRCLETDRAVAALIKDLKEHFSKDERVVVSEIRDKDAIVGSIKDFLGKGK